MYHIASTKDLPTMPEALSPPAREFLTQCFNRVPRERPTAQQLLSHPWMRDVQVPRAPPTPAHLPQLTAALQQQQQPPAAEQGLQTPHNHHLPGPGVHSPPSPILEEPVHDSPARLAVPVPPAPRPSALQPPAIRPPQVPGPENQVNSHPHWQAFPSRRTRCYTYSPVYLVLMWHQFQSSRPWLAPCRWTRW